MQEEKPQSTAKKEQPKQAVKQEEDAAPGAVKKAEKAGGSIKQDKPAPRVKKEYELPGQTRETPEEVRCGGTSAELHDCAYGLPANC